MPKPHILVTGALGQIGRVLVQFLVEKHGSDAVLATDLPFDNSELPCAYASLDATREDAWSSLIADYSFTRVYHLVAVLSAKGEANPWRSWDINMDAWRLVIEAVRKWPNCRVFFPSSIAVYGPPLPASVSENQVLLPTTSYGLSKVAGELWADYANAKFGTDIRCLRLPGVIGHQTLPGGGTTDYAVDIFHHAAQGKTFSCFLEAHTRLPMIYMDDVLRGIDELMETPPDVLAKASETYAAASMGNSASRVYNLTGFSVTPAELAVEIQQHIPDFSVAYEADFRQEIAESWPQAIEGEKASEVWGWSPAFDLQRTTEAMLHALRSHDLA